MSESEIFRDRSKLSPRYIPTDLPHREKQIEQIQHVFKESYSNPDKFPLVVLQIIGPAGIGKTSTVLKFSKLLGEDFAKNRLKIKTAYVNLKLQGGNKYAIYKFLLERIAPELPAQGLSAEEMLRYLLRYLRENKIYALIILDEIDYLIKVTKDSGIIYDLTRMNEFDPEIPGNVKGVIFIARSIEFYSKLDQAELSTLGRVPMEFPIYSIKQISDILISRCSEAFNVKAIGSDVIDEVSKITTSPTVNGDIRYALDLLLYAGNLAESQGTGRVYLDQIRKVNGQIHPSITTEEMEELSKNQIFTLIALVRALRVKKKQYVELKEIRSYALELIEEFKLKKLDIEDHLHDLQVRKIIEIRSLKEIGIQGASLQELEPILHKQIKHNGKNDYR
ncbi:MAG TPA: AAA family ATPase [Nitrososphaeraceae archaeon]|jgi:cell division control protein 6|nr:AAA family ATPase [Nitrososphaeraceae archaeon]